jgi:hypothetical protein
MSPESRAITSLTPRVVSRVASHNSPSITFSVPPRRPLRISPRFRHQTNSFSFDESERSSAAYEQQRASSGSTNGSTPRPGDDLSLHEELRSSSLHSSMAASTGAVLVLDPQETISLSVTSQTSNRCRRDFILSPPRFLENEDEDRGGNNLEISTSPHLPLPPPFSSARRSASNSEALPGGYGRSHFAASPVAISSSSPAHSIEPRSTALNSSQLGRVETSQRLAAEGSSPVYHLYAPEANEKY